MWSSATISAMDAEECKRRMQDALLKRQYPPTIHYPEHERRDAHCASSLFALPVLVWAPEAIVPNRKPLCIKSDCICVPVLKEYKKRIVQDIDHNTVLVYCKYQCTGRERACFTTISSGYLERLDSGAAHHFPYICTHKSGVSKHIFELVFDGIMSANGLSSMLRNVARRRQARYYNLMVHFADALSLQQSGVGALPPAVAQYLDGHQVMDSKSLTDIWLSRTEVYSAMSEHLMSQLPIKKVIRIDHSQKFCKRLKVHGANGQKVGALEFKMLLLVQNEIGQIVGRCATRSENGAELRSLLEHSVRDRMIASASDENEMFIVSDKANAVKGLVADLFGEKCCVKQDPFHVIMRFSEKIRKKSKAKWLAKELSRALFTEERQLRPAVDMEREFRSVLDCVRESDVKCPWIEWKGCVDSNMKQVSDGHLFVANNHYTERGQQVQIVSTSQLEGFHSILSKFINRSVSVEVGLRMLDILVINYNLKIGSRFDRNPNFHHADIIQVCQAALSCHGLIPDSPQMEFALRIASSAVHTTTTYRHTSRMDFHFEKWLRAFELVKPNTKPIEKQLSARDTRKDDIRVLLWNCR